MVGVSSRNWALDLYKNEDTKYEKDGEVWGAEIGWEEAGWGEGEVDEEMVEEDDHGTHAEEGKDEAEEGK